MKLVGSKGFQVNTLCLEFWSPSSRTFLAAYSGDDPD